MCRIIGGQYEYIHRTVRRELIQRNDRIGKQNQGNSCKIAPPGHRRETDPKCGTQGEARDQQVKQNSIQQNSIIDSGQKLQVEKDQKTCDYYDSEKFVDPSIPHGKPEIAHMGQEIKANPGREHHKTLPLIRQEPVTRNGKEESGNDKPVIWYGS